MATPPLITPLPAAPARSDGPAQFSPKADTFIAALPPMVTQTNGTLNWINDAAAATATSANNAAASAAAAATTVTTVANSATAATNSASAAATSATNAANSATTSGTRADNAAASATAASGSATAASTSATNAANSASAAAGSATAAGNSATAAAGSASAAAASATTAGTAKDTATQKATDAGNSASAAAGSATAAGTSATNAANSATSAQTAAQAAQAAIGLPAIQPNKALITDSTGTLKWGPGIPVPPSTTGALVTDGAGNVSWGALPTGDVTLNGVQTLTSKTITGLKETKVALAAGSAGAMDLAVGNVFTKTVTVATTFSLTNIPAAGTVATGILDLTNGGAFACTFTGWKWPGGIVPTFTASGRDVVGFMVHDNSTISGFILGKDVK